MAPATASIPRRHHYIPQMLLKNFTTTENKLWVVRTGSKEPFETGSNNLFAERDLYTTVHSNGRRIVALETWFSKLESTGGPFFEELIAAVRAGFAITLSDEAWEFWHLFMYYQFRRVPRRAQVAINDTDAKRFMAATIERELLTDPSALGSEDKELALERLLQNAVVMAQSQAPSQEVLEVFARLGMVVIYISDARNSFVIGDLPHGSALIRDMDLAFMPIAHDIAIGYSQDREVSTIRVDSETVRRMNCAIARQSVMIAGRSRELVTSLRSELPFVVD